VLLALGMFGALAIAVAASLNALKPARQSGVYPPACGTGHSMILSAQAVPSAALLPCIAALPSGWSVSGAEMASHRAVFWLDSDQAGHRAVTVILTAGCDTSGARLGLSDQPGARRFDRPPSMRPRFALTRMYAFAGGCVTYRFSFARGAAPSLAIPVESAVVLKPRSALAGFIQRTEGLALCGRGAPCPG
jgi:hypothetical protein